MTRRFALTRVLKAGMQGEDVKKLQRWLNTINLAYGFSNFYPDGVPENGKFQTFILLPFYHEYLQWSGYPIDHDYDWEVHSYACTDVNLALQQLGDYGTKWTT
jgi:hypothetical protein